MTETTARTYHTMESLRQMAQTDLRNVNRKELVDINEVEIRKDLSQRERMVDFISQIKNPYCYLDKGSEDQLCGREPIRGHTEKMRTDASEIKKKKAEENLHFSTLKR